MRESTYLKAFHRVHKIYLERSNSIPLFVNNEELEKNLRELEKLRIDYLKRASKYYKKILAPYFREHINSLKK
jgi:uncharacterized protein YlbG (UPF0298 family)